MRRGEGRQENAEAGRLLATKNRQVCSANKERLSHAQLPRVEVRRVACLRRLFPSESGGRRGQKRKLSGEAHKRVEQRLQNEALSNAVTRDRALQFFLLSIVLPRSK